MLRRVARALGTVRDLDVFREKAEGYVTTLPAERQSELNGLLAAWQTEHQRARSGLLDLFDDPEFVRFKVVCDEFLRSRGAGAAQTETSKGEPIAHRVRDVLPMVLLRSYAIVRAYDESVSMPDVPLARFHQLRIASKGLRYTLEFFADVMSQEVKTLIDQVKQLQEHLGDLQDAVVACGILHGFLAFGKWSDPEQKPAGRRPALIVAPGVAAYLAVRQKEIHQLVHTFPQVWSPIRSAIFRKRLIAIVEGM
jgi:CHAD domain-containing protein